MRGISIKGKINIPAKNINLSRFSFDDNHINNERNHNVTREEALSFIRNAKLSISKWNGRFENYYSFDGATYVDIENKNIRTAFKQEEFNGDVEKMIEVLRDGSRKYSPNEAIQVKDYHSND